MKRQNTVLSRRSRPCSYCQKMRILLGFTAIVMFGLVIMMQINLSNA